MWIRRVAVVAVACSSLAVGLTAGAGNAAAATTPPTFGPQVDIGSGYTQPWGVAVDSAGTTYVADSTANTVWRVPAGGSPKTAVGSGFRLPLGVAVDSAGNVYVADWGNGRAVIVVPSTGAQMNVATGLSAPSAVAVDADGNVFIADSGAGTVLKRPWNSTTLTTVASGFTLPTGLAVGADGSVYVADSSNAHSSITRIPPGGSPSTLVIPGLQNPNGVALDAGGNVFVANSGANTVLMLTPGGDVSRVGGGYIAPQGVAVNAAGDVVVADTYTPRVTLNPSADPQSITLTRTLPAQIAPGTTLALSATGGGSGNPVTFAVDPNTSPSGACTINAAGDRVRFTKVGTCVVAMDQAGTLRYLSAHRTVSVVIRPAGLASLVVSAATSNPSVDGVSISVRGKDAQGNDLGDVTAITTLTATHGYCYEGGCSWNVAGPSVVRANALAARGSMSVTVALGFGLESGNESVGAFDATVRQPIDALVYAYGGSSDSYTFTKTAGSFPPGVTLGSDGTFGGSPKRLGTFAFTLIVKDSANPGQRAVVASSITVTSAPGT